MGLKDKIGAMHELSEDAAFTARRQFAGVFAKKIVKIGIAVFAVLCVAAVFTTIAAVKIANREKKTPPPPLFTFENIAEEDIFLPGEPDFLPEVLLEQPQKKTWKEEDAQKFWTDPAEFGEEHWRKKSSEIIDGVLKRVP